jgi:predicted O-methyltransferase YrrM
MSSAAEDGRLFTALAAAKPGGAILELGTGTGWAPRPCRLA